MNDRTKLPKWAQASLALLESQVAHYKAQVAEMDAGDGVQGWGRDTQTGRALKHPIPEGEPFFFFAKRDRGKGIATLDARFDAAEQVLRVRTGVGAIIVKPACSNEIEISVERL